MDCDYPSACIHVFLSFDGEQEDELYLNTIETLGVPLTMESYPRSIDVVYKASRADAATADTHTTAREAIEQAEERGDELNIGPKTVRVAHEAWREGTSEGHGIGRKKSPGPPTEGCRREVLSSAEDGGWSVGAPAMRESSHGSQQSVASTAVAGGSSGPRGPRDAERTSWGRKMDESTSVCRLPAGTGAQQHRWGGVWTGGGATRSGDASRIR